MRQMWVWGIVVGAFVASPAIGSAAEHGGKEHGGGTSAPAAATTPAATPSAAMHEQGAAAQKPAALMARVEPSAEGLRQAIRDYISGIEADEGAFTIEDEITGDIRTLTLERVHERVGKTGDLYYSCTDMKDTKSGELLDLDFDVEQEPDGSLLVVDERIHKVNSQPRYTYDDKDNRIPVKPVM